MIDYYEFINILQKASTSDNIIEAIKQKLKAKYQDVYEEWRASGFDVNHIFTMQEDAYTQQTTLSQKGAYTHKITLLFEAVLMGNVNIVKSLIKNGANPSVVCDYYGNITSLHKAIEIKKLEIVKILLNAGNVEIEKKDKNGWTPLYLAIIHNRGDVVALLLEKGAKVDAIMGDNRCTSLHLAAGNGCKEMVALLLQNLTITHKYKWT